MRENVRFDGESRNEGRASIDRSIDSVGRGVDDGWWCSVDRRRRGGGGGVCSSSARTDAPVSVARRVESSRWMGRTHRERIANARRRGASTSRDAVPDRESDSID